MAMINNSNIRHFNFSKTNNTILLNNKDTKQNVGKGESEEPNDNAERSKHLSDLHIDFT